MLHSPLEADAGTGRGVHSHEHFVYVVDDQPALRQSACLLLSTLGISCTQFSTGRSFLDELDRLVPGCVLLDVVMDEVGGADVYAEMVRRGLQWPVIFMSGRRGHPAIDAAAATETAQFLDKPFAEEELLEALHRGFVALKNVKGSPESSVSGLVP